VTIVRVAYVVASVLLSGVAMVAAGAEFSVFAAGSLRAPLADLAQAYERDSGNKARLTFGASGLLRDRISGGERADVFASANMEHPQSLAEAGWTAHVERFARNSICLLMGARSHATTASALDAMIDPAVKLGTSTPKADPSGDYAWKVFHKAEALRPGAFATLTAKARQLTGGP
jgi:molybdate transport system substrate-binding protein